MKRPWILMNQAGEPSGGGAPGTPPVPPPAAPPPPTPAATPQPGDENQPWFKERLERAKREALAELGVTDTEKARKLLADAAKAEEAEKTQGQKLGETSKELERLRADNARKDEAIKAQVTAEMAKLKPEHQAVIRALAPDTDPTAQLQHIAVLAPTWAPAAQPPPAPGAPSTGATPPPAPPASGTAPPPNAPAQNGNVSPPDHKAIYEGLKKTNPHAASMYLNRHHAAIYPH